MGPTDPDRELAELRVDAAVARRRAAWQEREIAQSETTWTSVLATSAADGSLVSVLTAAGSTHSGAIVAIGSDVVVIRTRLAPWVIATGWITALDTDATLVGDQVGSAGTVSLAAICEELRAQRAEVLVETIDGERVRGVLQAVATDLLAVEMDAGRTRYVRLRLVTALSSSSISSS
jgi:hypothetical protein